jgi:hypothetical protein
MTSFLLVLGCVAFMFAIYGVRGMPGRAVADTALLVIFIGAVAIAQFVLGQFFETGNTGNVLVVGLAALLALDSLYGLMAPERQKQRDKKLRRLMKKRA